MSCNATDVIPRPDCQPASRRDGPAVLFIGYGNLLRSDDGVGPAVVSRLAASFFDNPRCATITAHQLTPELAIDVARAKRVVFVDASVNLPAGKTRVRRVLPESRSSLTLGHHLSPESIMALASSVCGADGGSGGGGDLCLGGCRGRCQPCRW